MCIVTSASSAAVRELPGDTLTVHESGVHRGHLSCHEGVDAVQDSGQVLKLQLLQERQNAVCSVHTGNVPEPELSPRDRH